MGQNVIKVNTEKTQNKEENTFSTGLSILRTFMCFEVILCHFWFTETYTGWKGWLSFFRGYAVPVFMLMSFFLTEKTLTSCNNEKIKRRFKRLIIPHIFWAAIYWSIYNILDLWKGYKFDCRISDLLWQFFTGHSSKLNGAMWYQVSLIALTFLFIAILHIFRKNYLFVLYVCTIGAWFFQYSGWNKLLFGNLRFELTYPLGRFSEMLPYAVCGFAAAHLNVYEKIKKMYRGGGNTHCFANIYA